MAFHKLSLSLFSAKSGIPQFGTSTQYLHLAAIIQRSRNQYAFVCEAQPLMTITNYGLPKRCPLCRQDNPIGS